LERKKKNDDEAEGEKGRQKGDPSSSKKGNGLRFSRLKTTRAKKTIFYSIKGERGKFLATKRVR